MERGKRSGTPHGVPASGGGWDVRRVGAKRASVHFEKREAIDRGREISRNTGTEFKNRLPFETTNLNDETTLRKRTRTECWITKESCTSARPILPTI